MILRVFEYYENIIPTFCCSKIGKLLVTNKKMFDKSSAYPSRCNRS